MQAQAALQYAKPLSTLVCIVSRHSQRLYAYFYIYKYMSVYVCFHQKCRLVSRRFQKSSDQVLSALRLYINGCRVVYILS